MDDEKSAASEVADNVDGEWPQLCVPLAQLVGHFV